MIGSGRDKCQVVGNWGLTGGTEPARVEVQDILFTLNLNDSTILTNGLQWTGRHNELVFGAGVTLEGVEWDSRPDWEDRRLYWKRFVLTGRTGAFNPGDEISFPRTDGKTGYTYVMLLDGNNLYIDDSDVDKTGKNVVGPSGETASHKTSNQYSRAGGTVTGPSGSATISSNSNSHLAKFTSTQVANDSYIRVFKWFGEHRLLQEFRLGADDEVVWSGYAHHHTADFIKLRPGGWKAMPKKLSISGLCWAPLCAKDFAGAPHLDGI